MKFPYSTIISAIPGSSDFSLIRRPEIPVTIGGPGGQLTLIGLVDTGSDNTIFPKSVADQLQIPMTAAQESAASVFGGHRVELMTSEVMLALEAEGHPGCAWRSHVCFYDFASGADECVILGHAGFLEFFIATFDGQLAELTLTVNDNSVVA